MSFVFYCVCYVLDILFVLCVCLFFFANTSASDCLKRLVSKMTCYVSSEVWNSTHSLSQSVFHCMMWTLDRVTIYHIIHWTTDNKAEWNYTTNNSAQPQRNSNKRTNKRSYHL